MAISPEQIKLLESYRDKAYITSILCSQSAEHFSFLRSIVNIPLILSSSTMTVLNSMSESDDNRMKFANICLNRSEEHRLNSSHTVVSRMPSSA